MTVQKRKSYGIANARYVSLDGLREYTGLGRNVASQIGKQSGAERKIGKRVIYDLVAIDKYLESMNEKRTD